MSCGCGGKSALPASVTLRMEAVRLSQAPDSRLSAEQVYVFITSGTKVDALDAPPAPIATGDSADAVTSRNALINAPLSRIHGLPKDAAAKAAAAGMPVLGTLVQAQPFSYCWKIDHTDTAALEAALLRYGLKLGMSTDDVRAWVLEGPA